MISDSLLQAAMLGIERVPTLSMDEALEAIARGALESRAGAVVPSIGQPLPVAPSDPNPLPHAITGYIRFLAVRSPSILPGFLRACSQHGVDPPHACWPDLFRTPAIGASLVADVLGPRGRWLAQLNPEWERFARWSDYDYWREITQQGKPAERAHAIHQLVRIDRDSAMVWAESSWKGSVLATRQAWAEAFALEPAREEEDWFESLLRDKGEPVRKAAMRGLGKIPESRWCERMHTWFHSIFVVERRPVGTRLLIRVPEPQDHDLLGLGFGKSQGQQLVFDTLDVAPIHHLVNDPKAFIELLLNEAKSDPWQGLAQALQNQDPTLVAVVAEDYFSRRAVPPFPSHRLERLSDADAERLFKVVLGQRLSSSTFEQLGYLLPLEVHLGPARSWELARAIVASIKNIGHATTFWNTWIASAIARLDPFVLPEALQLFSQLPLDPEHRLMKQTMMVGRARTRLFELAFPKP